MAYMLYKGEGGVTEGTKNHKINYEQFFKKNNIRV